MSRVTLDSNGARVVWANVVSLLNHHRIPSSAAWSPSELWSEKQLVRMWRPSDLRVVPQGMNCGQPLGSVGRGEVLTYHTHILTCLSLPVVIYLSQSASVVVYT